MNIDDDHSLRSNGYKRSGTFKEKKITKTTQFNVLRAVMPEKKAAELVGIPANHIAETRGNDDEVAVLRDKLQKIAGITLEDQAKWYMNIRNGVEDATMGERINAAKQIDTILGYNAPSKIDISERRELSAAISVVSNLGVNPMQLKKFLDERKNRLNVSTQ